MNEDGKETYPIKIGNKVYTDRTEGGEALKAAIGANIGNLAEGKSITVGEYRGLKLSVMFDTSFRTTKACLEGEKHHYCDLNPETNVGNLIRLDNCINNIEKDIDNSGERIGILRSELEQMKIDVEVPFPKTEELIKAETRLEEVHEELTKFELADDTMNKEIFERLAESFPDIISGKCEAMRFEAGEGFDTLSVEMHGTELSMAHTYEQNGALMYDPLISFEVDYDNEKVIPLRYENSGIGVCEVYDTKEDPTPASVHKLSDVLEFTDTWLDNIQRQGYEAVDNGSLKFVDETLKIKAWTEEAREKYSERMTEFDEHKLL